ncbi:unnamed protein product [Nippostrongylus brasiliensis]|uniref:ShKT domain-containing protein n=1 Tax=Nippostrongylus brasiliensis TaxID=27835 RepID=A0A0N4YVN9_NIPBR|nr:unnamed protein product [Nippostrongylus brasiliensis]
MLAVLFCILLISSMAISDEPCKDRSPTAMCLRHKNAGHCTSDDGDWVSIMKVNCRKTCEFCK